MAEKAILITNANIQQLRTRFQHDGTGVEPAVGYILVAGFGADEDYSVMSRAKFAEKYVQGESLHAPGWFEAVPKFYPNGTPNPAAEVPNG